MRAIVQRVSQSEVKIGATRISAIGPGMLVLVAVKRGDAEPDATALAERCAALRIFADEEGKMNLSVQETGGSVMVVSQFTLYGDTSRGHRPSWGEAAPPETAEHLYNLFVGALERLLGKPRVATGEFGAMMQVSLVNDGPVTVLLEGKSYIAATGSQ